jgi:cellulose biosynthesis protein BcsQ
MSTRTGTILTFYSFKGGSGRSMALANVAWILASHGKRVLVIDWDLEAPGVHRYFTPFLTDPTLARTEGLIEFVLEFIDAVLTPPDPAAGAAEGWHEPLADITRYATSLRYDFPTPGTIDLVPAGRQGPDYAARVASVDWRAFSERLGGGVFLESARRQMVEEGKYDYVLVDSRTGVSDTAGVCTMQMPDMLVACFTPNNQGIEGTAAVAASVLDQWPTAVAREGAETPRIRPLLCRVELAEDNKLRLRREYAQALFNPLMRDLDESGRKAYWLDAEVLSIPYYSYEEVLSPFRDESGQANSLLLAMERITGHLTGDAIRQLGVPPTPQQRADALAAYARRKGLPEPTPDGVPKRYDLGLFHYVFDLRAGSLVERLTRAGVSVHPLVVDPKQWKVGPSKGIVDVAQSCRKLAILLPGYADPWFTDSVIRLQEAIGNPRPTASEGTSRLLLIRDGPGSRRDGLHPVLIRNPVVELTEPDEPEDSLAARHAFRVLLAEVLGRERPPDLASYQGQCPSRGDVPLGPREAPLFHGREAELRALLDLIGTVLNAEARCVAVVGPSGVGKTSLVMAGLIPALQGGALGGAGWPVAVVRPGTNSLESLIVALKETRGLDLDAATATRLVAGMASSPSALNLAIRLAMAGAPPDRRLLLVVDPLGTLYQPGTYEWARREFLDNLVYAAREPGGRVVVVPVLRSGALGRLEDEPAFLDLVRRRRVRVEPMCEPELRRSILGPAEVAGLEVEPALLRSLLGDAGGQPGGLALLQPAIVGIWERREGRMLTERAYREDGGLGRGLSERAEAAYRGLSLAGQEFTRDLLPRLVPSGAGPTGGLPRVPIERRASEGTPVAEVEAVVRVLADARIVTTDEDDRAEGRPVMQLAHSALPEVWDRLKGWVADRQARATEKTFSGAIVARTAISLSLSSHGALNLDEFRPPLVVHVLWHPRWKEGQEYADRIYARIARDATEPLARSPGVPTYFHGGGRPGDAPPEIDLDRTRRTAVVVLGTSQMAVDERWSAVVRDLAARARASRGRHWVLPVAVTQAALRIDPSLVFDRIFTYDEPQRSTQMLSRVARGLCRMLLDGDEPAAGGARRGPAITVFFSFAHRDGHELVEALRGQLAQHQDLFAAHEFIPGEAAEVAFEANTRSTLMVAVQTDAFASRPWCRREILSAKRNGIPILVVDALRAGEPRSFPYLGNLPGIRWTGQNHQEILDAATMELLRCLYHRQRMTCLQRAGAIPEAARVLVRPPELLDCLDLPDDTPQVLVYPDPPLGSEELEALAAARPRAEFLTPSGSARERPLDGRTIGVSFSVAADGAPAGIGRVHFEDLFIGLIHHLLVQGAQICFCGDLRAPGLAQILIDLVRTHVGPRTVRSRARIVNVLAWPHAVDLDLDAVARLHEAADISVVPPPPDLARLADVALEIPPPADMNLTPYERARCMTAMREEMERRSQARVLCGGGVRGFLGRYPGIFEEAMLTLREGEPLYVLGGFGGCARALSEVIKGGTPEALTEDFQRRQDPEYNALFEEFILHEYSPMGFSGIVPIDYEAACSLFRAAGPGGLNNGLDAAENLRLFETIDLDEINFLITRGLRLRFAAG